MMDESIDYLSDKFKKRPSKKPDLEVNNLMIEIIIERVDQKAVDFKSEACFYSNKTKKYFAYNGAIKTLNIYENDFLLPAVILFSVKSRTSGKTHYFEEDDLYFIKNNGRSIIQLKSRTYGLTKLILGSIEIKNNQVLMVRFEEEPK
ncbi:Hypothetical protein CINCED_3A002081 [Cinara cedri]|uniref:Uncharacterized protein n=1 Tax=Cinara cedri TaxID=506608 RepID=A0A5E4N3H9_9HEMI|nr:Hypothetical protein CINCED_3A002081 [Cinara cedri]